jgi:hypothetical protein
MTMNHFRTSRLLELIEVTEGLYLHKFLQKNCMIMDIALISLHCLDRLICNGHNLKIKKDFQCHWFSLWLLIPGCSHFLDNIAEMNMHLSKFTRGYWSISWAVLAPVFLLVSFFLSFLPCNWWQWRQYCYLPLSVFSLSLVSHYMCIYYVSCLLLFLKC